MKSLARLALILCGILVLGWAELSSANASTQSYWVRIPATGQPCQSEALQLGQRLSRATDATVQSAQCLDTVTFQAEGESYSINSLLITYQSPTNPALYSATLGLGADTIGAYETYASCLSEIEKQTSEFESQTGLVPVAAYCLPATMNYPKTYVMHLDGFGKPKATLHVFEFPYFRTADKNRDQIARTFIEQAGGRVVSSSSRAVYYYGAKTVPVQMRTLALFENTDQCQSQAPEITKLLGTETPSKVTCIDTGHGVAMDTVWIGYGIIQSDLGIPSPRYFTFDECMKDRGRVNSKGAICRPGDTGGYVMEIFR